MSLMHFATVGNLIFVEKNTFGIFMFHGNNSYTVLSNMFCIIILLNKIKYIHLQAL